MNDIHDHIVEIKAIYDGDSEERTFTTTKEAASVINALLRALIDIEEDRLTDAPATGGFKDLLDRTDKLEISVTTKLEDGA